MKQNEELIQAAAEAVEIFGEDALEEWTAKTRLIDRLVKDFKETTPEYRLADVKLLRRRLEGFTNADLELLCEGIK